MTAPAQLNYDAAYRVQRQRLIAIVAAAVGRMFASAATTRGALAVQALPVVEAGQKQIVALLDAYMAAKATQAGASGSLIGLDTSRYLISELRNGVSPTDLYGRPVGAYLALLNGDGYTQDAALAGARATLDKLVRTDLQLTQTHAARDWMHQYNDAAPTDELRIVGYRRMLTGPGPHCALCTAASTRTYRIADLMPIHERCGCTVQPVWGTEAVTSVGTTVRVENDPELGPRLMAASWSPVGKRL